MLPLKKEVEEPETETSEDSPGETEESEESTEKASTKVIKKESEDSEGDDEEGDKKSNKSSKFFDPNKVPEEMKPVWKSMQASFTRAMQAARHSTRKAEAFDELVANPEFQAWVASKNETPPKKGKAAASDDDDDDKGVPDIEGMIERAVAKSLAPIIRGEHRKNAQAEWDKLLDSHPQAENYKDEIAEAMRETPGLGYQKAFKLVAFDDAISMGSESAIKSVASKKRANTSTPSKISPGDKAPGRAKSIPEAFKMAVKQEKDQAERG